MSHSACIDRGPNDFHCERQPNHTGPHRALDGEEEWENGDD